MAVDAELDRLVEKRARAGDAEALQMLWTGSVRRHKEAIRRRNRAAWYGWHMHQAERHRRTLEELIAHHETQAARLCESEPTKGA